MTISSMVIFSKCNTILYIYTGHFTFTLALHPKCFLVLSVAYI